VPSSHQQMSHPALDALPDSSQYALHMQQQQMGQPQPSFDQLHGLKRQRDSFSSMSGPRRESVGITKARSNGNGNNVRRRISKCCDIQCHCDLFTDDAGKIGRACDQ
jgi:hypothetical protein